MLSLLKGHQICLLRTKNRIILIIIGIIFRFICRLLISQIEMSVFSLNSETSKYCSYRIRLQYAHKSLIRFSVYIVFSLSLTFTCLTCPIYSLYVQIEGLCKSNYCGISATQLQLSFTVIKSIFTHLRNTKVVFYREPLSAVLKPQQCCGERGMDEG